MILSMNKEDTRRVLLDMVCNYLERGEIYLPVFEITIQFLLNLSNSRN